MVTFSAETAMIATMNSQEKRATYALAGIFSFRMLGLFMILPVFALYAQNLAHSTPFLIGLALGIYGLTQACFQIPFGMLSDRIGRKPIIVAGLIIFALGSLVAALSHGIIGVIIGRALQGAGAIGSTTMALLADLTHEEHRSKSMAIVGMTIGFSFTVAIIIGPILSQLIGVTGIFYLTSVLAFSGIALLYFIVPTPARLSFHQDTEPMLSKLPSVLKNKELLRLNFGIFTLHTLLTANFVVLPIVFLKHASLEESQQWLIYLPALLLAFLFSLPMIVAAEVRRKIKSVFVSCILILALTTLGFWFFQFSTFGLLVMLWLFFTAFTVQEALLPSLISKIAPAGSKGTAMGVYSTSQFLGIFVGGLVAGWLFQHFFITDIFLFSFVFAMLWFVVAVNMAKPPHLSTLLLHIGNVDQTRAKSLAKSLLAIDGVMDASIALEEGTAHLKVDKKILNQEEIVKWQEVSTKSS
ncbi:MAG: MFS transporter [Gammaproteobacteria bacterium]